MPIFPDLETAAPVDLTEWADRVAQASRRIYSLVEQTPLSKASAGNGAGFDFYLKREDLQKTGSFKLRGATNKMMGLSAEELSRGVVTSSTGNHGLGVAAAARHLGADAEVFVASHVSSKKLAMIRDYGARLRVAGETPLAAELAARTAAFESGRCYISPYNDVEVVAGQGTIAAELVQQLPDLDVVYVAVGGGGLISGIGLYLKHISPRTEIVGCWPENSPVMYKCLRTGKIVDVHEEPTVSESTAGGVEPGSVTFPLCRRVIDRAALVAEEQIISAMRWATLQGCPLEGAAGVAIAAVLRDARALYGKTVVAIACGRNTSPEVTQRVQNTGQSSL